MKLKLITIMLLLVAITVAARLIAVFSDWNWAMKNSPNIIIAHCGKQSPSSNHFNAPASDFSIKVLTVLKGATNVVSARLLTDHELITGQNYLVFGYYDAGIYTAYEEFRIVPLGVNFSTNLISGKSLDDQLQILFKLRRDQLNQEIQKDKEEKQRLEELPIK